jgi:carbon-monoxide dehydrogenase small subunit
VRSCLMFAVSLEGAEITTVEGCRNEEGGMGPVQQAFQDCHALQCGFCTPGFITTITAYLEDHENPTADEAREAISGNLCRCTGYQNIVAAIRWAAEHPDGATAADAEAMGQSAPAVDTEVSA